MQTAGWTQIMVPTAEAEIASNINALIKDQNARKPKASDDRLKGRVEGLQWWLNIFQRGIAEAEAKMKQEEADAKELAAEAAPELKGPFAVE